MTRPKPKPPAATPKPASVPFPNAVETGKEEVDRALQILLATQRERIAAVVSRSRDRSRGINMQLKMDGGNLAVKFTHESPDAAALILMADLATMDPAFYLGVTGQIAQIARNNISVLRRGG